MAHRTVFILGAGASKQAGAPLMRDFLDVADLVRERQQTGSQTREYFDLVFRAISELDPVFAKSSIDVGNIESIFAAFEMAELFGRLGSLKQSEVGRLTSAIKSLIVTTLETRLKFPVVDRQIRPPSPYSEFASLVHRLSSTQGVSISIMTFNYEIAVDYALQYTSMPINYCLNPKEPPANISLLKLHGSLNWTQCSKCHKITVLEIGEWFQSKRYVPFSGNSEIELPISLDLPQCGLCGVPSTREPLIVPPTWNKTQHYAEIRNVWSVAASHLSEAENIIVIGYSLPETDHFFHYLYALGTVGSTRLKRFLIFNPDPRVEERFLRLLGPVARDRMKHFKSTFSESIGPITDALLQN